MELTQEIFARFIGSLLQLFIQPLYYLGILFIILQYRRQVMLERKLFHTRLHSVVEEVWRTILWGWVAGLAASFVMGFLGVAITMEAIVWIWGISIVLIFFRLRYLCFAYAAGGIGILWSVVQWFPQWADMEAIRWLTLPLSKLDMPSLLALAGILHLIEALLIRWQGARAAMPLFMEGKRGKIVGGYQLHGFWPVPLFLVIPANTDGSWLAWTPLFGGGLWSDGWAMIAFPVVIGFAEMTMSRLPLDKVRLSSTMLFSYGLVVVALALIAEFLPAATIAVSALVIMLHEALVLYSGWEETKRSPFYVHSPQGLKILDVIPNSPAMGLGIVAGEIIYKVNGVRVGTKEELHKAMQLNSAFCKMEILNLEGQSKFVSRGIFAGEHHQLGILLAPDEDAMYYVGTKQSSLFAYLAARITGLFVKKARNEHVGTGTEI